MRLVSYAREGVAGWGVVVDDAALVEGASLFGGACASLREVLAQDRLAELRATDLSQAPRTPLAGVELLPVVPDPDKIVFIGLNYESHIQETRREKPKYPRVFLRLTNTLIAHGQPMLRPRVSEQFDYEGELAVIIGRPCRYVTEADALSYVAGYTCFVDGTLRDFQEQSVIVGKNFPKTGPLGPWMVTADEIPDPTRLHLATRLNGQEVQSSGVDRMMYSIPNLIAYISTFTELVPGDVIATGTPDGVGSRRNPPLWLKAGDRLEVEISGIGVLQNTVVDE